MVYDVDKIFKKPPRYELDTDGRRKEIIIDMEAFEEFMEGLEDYLDSKYMDETDGEDEIEWEDVKQQLKAEGKL